VLLSYIFHLYYFNKIILKFTGQIKVLLLAYAPSKIVFPLLQIVFPLLQIVFPLLQIVFPLLQIVIPLLQIVFS